MPSAPPIVDKPKRWDQPFDPDMSDAVVDRLLATAPFREMKPENFRGSLSLRGILKNDTRLRRYSGGEIVVREGDYGTSAFLILTGSVRVVVAPGLPEALLGRRTRRRRTLFQVISQLWGNSKYPEVRRGGITSADPRLGQRGVDGSDEVRVFLQDVPRVLDEHKTAHLAAGELFGEIAALSRIPRTATVFAEDNTELLEIRWQGLRDLRQNDAALKQHTDKLYRERALETYLRSLPLFARLNDEQLQRVMAATEFATFGDYDWSRSYQKLVEAGQAANEPLIAAQGDYPNGVVLVRAGFVRVTQKFGRGERTLSYLGAGGQFGLAEIAHNWRTKEETVSLQYSLRALGYAHVLIVPTAIMEEIVLPTARELPALDAVTDAGKKLGGDLLEFVTEGRYFNGTATMLIDLNRCTRCDDCVRACAATHDNNPRFLRHGPVMGRVMIANACMHCADPVCMIGCPTGAIHRNAFGGQVVINQATCIGCRICETNCPYDAIRMVEARNEQGIVVVTPDSRPVLKATKCDLCATQYGGPACARACPHDALARVNMNDADGLARWLAR